MNRFLILIKSSNHTFFLIQDLRIQGPRPQRTYAVQASVRRGPRASATSHFTVSLTESEIGLTQQASVRRGPRASANLSFHGFAHRIRNRTYAASVCSPRSPCLGDLSFFAHTGQAASLCSPRSPCLGDKVSSEIGLTASVCSPRSPCLGDLSFHSKRQVCSPRSPCLGDLSFHRIK